MLDKKGQKTVYIQYNADINNNNNNININNNIMLYKYMHASAILYNARKKIKHKTPKR